MKKKKEKADLDELQKKILEETTQVVDEIESRLSGLKPCNKRQWGTRAALLVYYAEIFAEKTGIEWNAVLRVKESMKEHGLLEAEAKTRKSGEAKEK